MDQHAFPIALDLLDAERARLMNDHYDDGEETDCDGCIRAHAIRLELEGLAELGLDSRDPRYVPSPDEIVEPFETENRYSVRTPLPNDA
jgi:hypothetical protein